MISHNSLPSDEAYPDQAILLETDLNQWHERMDDLMDRGAKIIAIRGAGSANGIEPEAAVKIEQLLHLYVAGITATGAEVALMYDGDSDVREKPGLGSVFGALVDGFSDDNQVTALAVQTKNWYEPSSPGEPLASATARPYETYVFNRDMDDIDPSLRGRGLAHSALTQSSDLVAYENYEQIVVGAVGPIVVSQMQDLARKAQLRPEDAGPLPVTLLAARINPALDEMLRDTVENDPREHRRIRAAEKLVQRANYPYGLLFTPEGEFALDPADYPNVSFQTVVVA